MMIRKYTHINNTVRIHFTLKSIYSLQCCLSDHHYHTLACSCPTHTSYLEVLRHPYIVHSNACLAMVWCICRLRRTFGIAWMNSRTVHTSKAQIMLYANVSRSCVPISTAYACTNACVCWRMYVCMDAYAYLYQKTKLVLYLKTKLVLYLKTKLVLYLKTKLVLYLYVLRRGVPISTAYRFT